ncbi:SulP family inorganic anion transporter, partial [Ilumatobacter sp.]|uniref:SulP family inorganic anion transporter n=1 Tax=Ilumatobacter sp. TaxID=1967498 RepID=UPI003AF6DF23
WAIVVPESVAYAGIAGVPPAVGLYVATVPLIVYALLGSSRRMTVGPSATSAAVSAAAVAPLAADAENFLQLTIALTIVVGIVLGIAAIAKLGILAEFLSEPVLKGFITGVAITIAGGQLGKVLGVEAEGEGFIAEMVDLGSNAPDAHGTTILVGIACLAALVLLERILPKLPSALVVVIGAIAAARSFDLEERGVELVGEIEAGLPTPGLPDVSWEDVLNLIPGALGVAIVVFGESMALAKSFGARHGERIDADAELGALGGANAVGGVFGGFAGIGSNSRTAAADAAGQKTQLASMITGGLLILTMLFLTQLFEDLPEAALGAIIIHAVIGLIRFRPLTRLRERSQVDFLAALTTLAGVLLFDILVGLAVGVAVSIVGMMRRAVRPRVVELGLDPETGNYWALGTDGVERLDDVVIVRFEAELFFANVSVLRDTVLAAADAHEPATIVIDAESISHVDTTAAEELDRLLDELDAGDIEVRFARLERPVADTLTRCGVELGDRVYNRVSDAVGASE